MHQHSRSIDILMIPQRDAVRTPQPFLDAEYAEGNAQFSPDGRFVAYLSDRTGENQVYVRPYPGPGAPEIVSVDGGVEPIWGANGELFYRHPVTHALISVAVSTEPNPVTHAVDGGVEPIWGANGELFYRHPVTHALISVAVSTEPNLRLGVPELRFDEPGFIGVPGGGSSRALYDISRDGQRFVMLQSVNSATSEVAQPRINIVLNWFEELKERVPVP